MQTFFRNIFYKGIHMFKRKPISLLISLAAVGLSAPTFAADAPASPHTFTANVGLYSQYVFRGLTQTNEDPAIQGGFDYSHASGFYLGTWASNISWLRDNASYSGGGSAEIDLYGGFKGSVGDFGYDVGLLQYYYPGTVAATFVKADTLEAYVAGSWKWFSLKYSHALSNKVFGVTDARGTYYLDLSASVPVAETGLTLGAHYGTQVFDGNNGTNDNLYSYDDWKVSASYDLGKASKTFDGVTVGIAYTDTNAEAAGYTILGKNIGKSQTTVWISKSF